MAKQQIVNVGNHLVPVANDDPLADKRLKGKFAGNKVIVKKTFTNSKGNEHATRLLDNALKGKSLPENLTPNVLKELQMILTTNGLTLAHIIETYKKLLNEPHERLKGGDVIKILSRLEKLHGINEKSIEKSQDLPEDMGKAVEDGNVHRYIFEINEKTKSYLDKLERMKSEKVVEGSVIGQSDKSK